MKKILLISLVAVLCGSCRTEKGKNHNFYDSIPNRSCENIEIKNPLVLDTLIFDGKYSSMEGSFFILRDTVFMADPAVQAILAFDKNGKYLGQKVRRGAGPDKLVGVNTASARGDGCVVIDNNWTVSVFDKNWHRTHSFQIDWAPKQSLKDRQNNPDPEDSGIYELEYYKPLVHAYGDSSLLIHITTENPLLNAYQGPGVDKFYNEAYSIGQISLSTRKVEKLLCPYPPLYSNYKYLPTFKNQLFDTRGDKLYYSFEADPQIYCYNIHTSEIFSFGNPGKNMETKYPEYHNAEDTDANYSDDREKYGFYSYLKCDPINNLIFRGYRKGENLPDGLQIYSGDCLIGDVEVPRGFEIIGYSAPWYYAYGNSDFEQENMTFYRFKL